MMGNSLSCVWLLFALSSCPNIHSADLLLAKKGKARAAIYVPAGVMDSKDKENWRSLKKEHLTARVRESVKDLAHYLGKISGVKFEIVIGPQAKGDKRVQILVGELALKEFGGLPAKTKHKQGLRVVVSSRKIGLFGETGIGTSYAIYEFLHRLGCRWFMPSEFGEVVPSSPDLAVSQMNISTAPSTKFRGIWYADANFLRRNRLGGIYLHAGHALESYITEKQREEHPEWKAIVGGKPHPVRLKWTHPDVATAIADTIIARLDKNPDTISVSLSPGDGIGWDEEMDPKFDTGDWDDAAQVISKTDRLLILCNRICSKVTQKHPRVIFGMLAYVDYTKPPLRENVHPKLIPQIAPITYNRAHPMTTENHPNGFTVRDLVKGWGKITPGGFSAYWYTYNLAEVSAPNPFITKYSTDLPILFDNNCQFWQPETMANFETVMPALVLGMRLSWDKRLKPSDVIEDLMTKFYGSAAGEMTAYWNHIDRSWIDTREFSGCGFGYLCIFTPEVLKKARQLMNEALAACSTPLEHRRVYLANESLILLEQFMKLRRDLADGRLAKLKIEADIWRGYAEQLARNYRPQYCFGSYRGRSTWPVAYFDIFYRKPYEDGARIAKEFGLLSKKPLRNWKIKTDKEVKGEGLGYAKIAFDDKEWKTTDVGIETWSTIGHHSYMGHMWYRTKVKAPKLPAGKKVFLWVPSTDGSVKVFVNGKHVKWVNRKGEVLEKFSGYCAPASFDVTGIVKGGTENQISLLCHRSFLNELGTGGLLAPPMLYREK